MRIICGAMVYGRNETMGCIVGVTIRGGEDRVTGLLIREIDEARGCRYLPFQAIEEHDGRHVYTDQILDRITSFDEKECSVARSRMDHWLDSLVENRNGDGEELEERFSVIERSDLDEFPLLAETAITIDRCRSGRIASIEVDDSGYVQKVVVRSDDSIADVHAVHPTPKRTREDLLRRGQEMAVLGR